ncbi:hypothetical protein DVH24_034143 [Malus domestica]|uniref:Uncharacterized protein n=1 Tax=Malus domestica TaxID=3750 RepID=A0A498I676_MALDO|nr:hypothetical protein DVH24_034143 [Malus domestica]
MHVIVTSCPELQPHPGLDSTVARYYPLWALTTPSLNSHKNFLVSHPSWDCSHGNSLNFRVLMEPEASELPKGLVLGRDENIHIRFTRSTPLDDVGCYTFTSSMMAKQKYQTLIF